MSQLMGDPVCVSVCMYVCMYVCVSLSVCLSVCLCIVVEISVKHSGGFVSLSIPLPSRRERCVFTFLPATQTVADLVLQLKLEDKGTDHVNVYSLGN